MCFEAGAERRPAGNGKAVEGVHERRSRDAGALACCDSTGEHEVGDEDIYGIPFELGEHVLGEGECGCGAGEFQGEQGGARPRIYRRDGPGRETIRFVGVGGEGAARLLEPKP